MLATEVTAIVHGRDAAEQAGCRRRAATFEAGALDLSLPTADVLACASSRQGIGILAALVTAGLAGSNGEARRHIQSGAVRRQRSSSSRTTSSR